MLKTPRGHFRGPCFSPSSSVPREVGTYHTVTTVLALPEAASQVPAIGKKTPEAESKVRGKTCIVGPNPYFWRQSSVVSCSDSNLFGVSRVALLQALAACRAPAESHATSFWQSIPLEGLRVWGLGSNALACDGAGLEAESVQVC